MVSLVESGVEAPECYNISYIGSHLCEGEIKGTRILGTSFCFVFVAVSFRQVF